MKYIPFVVATLSALTLSTSALAAGKSCDELKEAITTKLEGKHVKGYTLDIVDAGATAEGRVVAKCERGAKKIVYSKNKK